MFLQSNEKTDRRAGGQTEGRTEGQTDRGEGKRVNWLM